MRVKIFANVGDLPENPEQASSGSGVDQLFDFLTTWGMNGIRCFLVGNGSVDLYSFQDRVWRKFPNGEGISDDGFSVRFVTDSWSHFFAFVDAGSVDEDTKVYASALDRE